MSFFGDHDGHDPECTMKSALNWDSKNVCVLVTSWKINSYVSLFLSCIVLFCLGMFYEKLRTGVTKWQKGNIVQIHYVSAHANDDDSEGQHYVPPNSSNRQSNKVSRLVGAVMTGALLLYSYALMLVVMTYNGFLISAVILGAVAGNYYFSENVAQELQDNSLACH